MLRSIKIVIFSCLVIASQAIHSQWRLNQISGDEGLSQNTIKSIIQDKDGFIWIGTYNGINKYDGYTMKHYNFSEEDTGLSSNLIHSLFEDNDGFIWAGTSDAGINRIDPGTGKVDKFFNSTNSSGYFRNVDNLHQLPSGIIFYHSRNELKLFKVSKEGELLFNQSLSEINGTNLLGARIIPSKSGEHWLFTPRADISLELVTITEKDKKVHIESEKTNLTGDLFENGYAVNFYEHSKNTIWIVSNLLQLWEIKLDDELQITSKKLIDLRSYSPELSEKSYQKIAIQADKNNRLWFAGDRLLLNYDIESGKVSNLNDNKNYEINHKQINQLIIDNSNILWFGTQYNGLYKIDLENNTILNSNDFFKVTEQHFRKFHKYPIIAMCEDNDGNIWMGTSGNGGLALFKEKEIQQTIANTSKDYWTVDYLAAKKKFRHPSFFEIKRLMNDSNGNIWVGAKTGLSRITQSNNSSTFDVKIFDNLKDINGNNIQNPVFAIEEDFKGNIWAGYWNDGLVKISYNEQLDTYNYVNFKNDPTNLESISNNIVRDIFEDNNHNLWVGTIGGLNKLEFDEEGNTRFIRYFKKASNKNSLSNNYVLDVFQSKNGKLYVGTFGGGLNEIEISENQQLNFKHYTVKEGLPSDVVYQIREDDQGNLWLLHVRVISKLNPTTGEISYFEKQDGFNVDEFKENSMLFTSSGIMVCGGVNGFTFFKPDNLSVNSMKPQLTITDFKLFNESVEPNKKIDNKVILEKSINDTKEITLPYNLNSIEFEFSSLHYSNPEKNQYKYILEGFNDNWQYSRGNDRRFASYTNVPPGNYTFKVLGSNSSGIWTDEPKQIAITINQPWYSTPLATFIFIFLLFSIVYAFVKIRLNQIRLKSELELESALHEKSDEINKMKLQFFTNISHELRTPLTLVIGPLQQIMKGNTDPNYLQRMNAIMYKNSVRLHKLINQLLDFRKAESGRINLIVQNGDLVSFVGEIYDAFEEIAVEKDIKFLYVPEEKSLDAWFDNDKIEKIIYNLLSNAFKFTPKGKSIKLILEKKLIDNQDCAVLKVMDYGVGIPKDELQSIFERFYQTKKENESIHIGSGLGLAYTKHLVEIHKGSIHIESELHKGTTCTVSIPLSKTAYEESAIIESQPNQYSFKYLKKEIEDIKENVFSRATMLKVKDHDDKTPTILIVEDNQELQEYLFGYFNQNYKILSANDGVEGLKLALNHSPDIIISDLMMPKMDGIEMCKKIKTDIRTSHIPVIILTAKAGLENEKEGLETGADEFILKPFNVELLKLRVENILRTKKIWIDKFKTNSNSKPWKELSNKLDKDFIEKSVDIVKKNLDNSEFSVEKFSLDIALSRSALFKKIKAISGQSTSEFIRTVRLNKASELLKTGKYSITEIVFMVGFSDPKYFRTCFKKLYKQTPSDYLSSFKNEKFKL